MNMSKLIFKIVMYYLYKEIIRSFNQNGVIQKSIVMI